MKILVPMDGSETALRALDLAIRRISPGGGEIRVLTVQLAIPASVGDFVGAETVRGYHRDEADKALGPARERLAVANVPHAVEMRIGPIAETIAADAAESGCDEIVMGHRGMGGLSTLLLGSVADRVLRLAEVPVTIVK